MFRLKRKLNLTKMAKASASCPAINEMHLENTSEFSADTTSPQSEDECESDDGGLSGVSRKERLIALKSIRRDRKREKDQKKKLQSNNISMDDFLSKQTEFKIWLKEEKNKDAKELASPKLKTYFKTFVKHWNRKKLNQKYYRGSELVDTPQPSAIRQRYIFADTDSCSSGAVFPRTIDLSMEGPDSLSSPFSTFGKSPLGLPITRETPRRPAASKKVQKAPEDDTDKENRQANTEDIEESAVKQQGTVEADSDITVPSESNANLYEVSVLSWTSRGELATGGKSPVAKSRRAKPVPPLHCPMISESQTTVRLELVPCQEQQDRGSSNLVKHNLMPVSYEEPGYMDIDCCTREETKTVSAEAKPDEQNITKLESPLAIYAVPMKKKKMVVSTKAGNGYTGTITSSAPPPIPPKRKSPHECWPYANSLMGTNIPAPCYSLNKGLNMQKSKESEVQSFRRMVQSSSNKISEQVFKKNSLHPDHFDVKDIDNDINNKQSAAHAIPTRSSMTKLTNVELMSERTETPPPQLVPVTVSANVADGGFQNSSVPPADLRHSKYNKRCVLPVSSKPLRFETTFSATDIDSPIKRSCPGIQTSRSLDNITETSTRQHINVTSTHTTNKAAKFDRKTNTKTQSAEITGENNYYCKESSVASTTASIQNQMSVTDVAVNNKLSSEVSDDESDDEEPHQGGDLYETDIDDLDDDDDDVDDCDHHGYDNTNTRQGFIETDLDEVLEKVTQQNKVSTRWLVDTDKETTV